MTKGDLIYHNPSGRYGIYLDSREHVIVMTSRLNAPPSEKYKKVVHYRVCLSSGAIVWFAHSGIRFINKTDKNCPGQIHSS